MPKITAQGKTIDCAVGANLRQVLLAADVDLYNGQARLINCRGIGSCGTCAVQIEGIADAVSVVNWRDGRRPVPSTVWRKFANHFLGRGSRGAWEPGSQKVVLFAPSDTRTIVPVAVCPPTIAMVADRSLGTIGPYGWPAKPEFRGIPRHQIRWLLGPGNRTRVGASRMRDPDFRQTTIMGMDKG
jgi:hypothetical protein